MALEEITHDFFLRWCRRGNGRGEERCDGDDREFEMHVEQQINKQTVQRESSSSCSFFASEERCSLLKYAFFSRRMRPVTRPRRRKREQDTYSLIPATQPHHILFLSRSTWLAPTHAASDWYICSTLLQKGR